MDVPQTEITIRSSTGAILLQTTVAPGDYVLGRSPEAELHFEADLVSRQHARLTVNYDQIFIEDLRSANGTTVNEQPITKPTRLWPNQKVQIGTATMELRRIKTLPPLDGSLAPGAAAIGQLLPEECLREKKYAIGKVVAQGGMGVILNAHESPTQRTVAMKVMLDSSSAAEITRFITEARITGQLEHPNIVPIHELSVDEHGQPYYTMKMVRGVTLGEVLGQIADEVPGVAARYPLGHLLTIFQKVCDAVAFAHSRSIIHRDLKPENIMLGDFGEVLVMDWGLAKKIGRVETSDSSPGTTGAKPPSARESSVRTVPVEMANQTMAGTILGTPAYMSPEQARGEVEELDARSDVYALGAILFQMLFLKAPFRGKTVNRILEKVQRGAVEWPENRGERFPHLPAGRVPDSLLAVCRQALAFERGQRYPQVADLQRDLEAYQNGFATSAENAGTWKQLTLLVQRHRAAAGAIAASVLLIAVVTVVYTVRLVAARDAERQATAEAKAALQQTEQARAVAEERRVQAEQAQESVAKASAESVETLNRLKATVPAVFDGARGLARDWKFEEALDRLSLALTLEPENAGYNLLHGQILQTLERHAEAAKAFDTVLGLRAVEAVRSAAQINRDLCRDILRQSEAGALPEASRARLARALDEQGRHEEANSLKAKGQQGAEKSIALIKRQLDGVLGGLPGFSWDGRLEALADNTFRLNLGNLKPLTQIPRLQGLPITELHLGGSSVRGLELLKGVALKRLWLGGTAVSDLGPLAGMPLLELDLAASKVTNLAPLRSAPLQRLLASGNPQLVDLEPLAGLPDVQFLDLNGTGCIRLNALAGLRKLRTLWLSGTRVEDLAPLRGVPLEELVVDGTRIQDDDLAIVVTLPLQRLSLRQCAGIRNLDALARCRTLQVLALPPVETLSGPAGQKSFYGVRFLPNLRLLTDRQTGSLDFGAIPPQEEFWAMHSFNGAEMRPVNGVVEAFTEAAKRPTWRPNLDGKVDFDMEGLPRKNIEPLRALPIKSLNAFDSPVADFSPLAATPIHTLSLGGPKHQKERIRHEGTGEDFRSVARLTTLQHLSIAYTDLNSVEPFVGLKLQTLLFPGTLVTDVQPLLQIPTLQAVILPRTVRNVEALRTHPGLKFIAYGAESMPRKLPAAFPHQPRWTAAQFWAEHEARKAGARP